MQNTIDLGVFGKQREQYAPDAFFDPGRFTLAVIGCLGFAALIAAGLSFLFYGGFYFIIFVPLLAGLACGAACMYAVKFSHCRNPLLAGLLGGVVSLVAYLGGYHACMLWEVGIQNAHRIDALPTYLSLRWQTDTVEDARDLHGDNENNRGQPSDLRYWGNVVLFAFEAFIMAGTGFALPWTAAKRPYCAKHKNWLVEAKGSLRKEIRTLEEAQTIQGQLSQRGADEFSIHHCPSAKADNDECEIYLTATRLVPAGSQTKREKVIENIKLNADEIGDFSSLLPLDRQRSLPSDGYHRPPSRPGNHVSHSRGVATVTKVGPPDGGRFSTSFHRFLRNAMSYSPLLGLVGGMGLMCGPLALENIGWEIRATGWWTLVGFLLLPLTAFWCVMISSVPYNSMRRIAERNFPQRASSIVGHAGSESRFAIIMPRNEVSSNSFRAWDFGILEADVENQEVRFEGDIERYRIPVESITALDIEPVVFCSSQNSVSYEYLVRFVFQTEHGPTERMFSQRHLWRAMSKDEARRQPAIKLFQFLQTAIQVRYNHPEADIQYAGKA